MAETAQEISASDWAVLALVAEAPSHGWAIATQLARGGEVGSIWSLGRPIVYHALAHLEQEGLIRTAGLERGSRGPHRVIYAVTPAGRKAIRRWLLAPIQRVREIRSLFLLKVVLSERAGIDVAPLLNAQRRMMMPFIAWLEAQLDDADPDVPSESTVLTFRLESARMVVDFIDGMLEKRAKTAAKRASKAPAKPRR